MDSKTKEVRNAYMREWRAKNKDKVKAHQEKYWSNKAQELSNKEIVENNMKEERNDF